MKPRGCNIFFLLTLPKLELLEDKMVVFTCNNCGDSLQKPKVEKHYSTICNTFKNLTCVDCLKDFKGEDYGAHIKCISEKERYAAKGAPITVVNKGEVKQQQWSDMVFKIISEKTDVTPSQKIVFDILTNFIINVPRKKMKFMNFVKNAGGNRIKYDDIESVWELIEEYKGAQDKTKVDDSIIGEDSTNNNMKLKQGNEFESRKSLGAEVEEITTVEEKSKNKKSMTDLGKTLEESKKRKSENTISDIGADISLKKKKKNNKRTSSDGNVQVQESNLEKEVVNSAEPVSNGNSKEDGQKKKKKKSIGESIHEENGNSSCLEETKVNEENGANGIENLHNRIIQVLKKKGNLSDAKLQKKVLKKYCQETGIEETPELIKEFNKLVKKIEFIGNETETKKRKSKSLDVGVEEISNTEVNSKTDFSNLDQVSSMKRKPENDVTETVAVVEVSLKKKKKNNKRASKEANDEVQNSNFEKEIDVSVINGNSKEDRQKKKSILDENGHESLNDMIIMLLKKKGNLSIAKLQKGVLKQYYKETGAEETPKLVKKFNKLLKKLDCVEITNDNVKLLHV
ncbi:hypothetical protein FQR65_LT05384 [Abscondita terminalis]|nr:hypothetical protein FQR65_LT05384 [Abscondita terminalis]